MGGASLGGMFGGPSTLGSNVNAPANTTPSVMGATGHLEAFNPATMAGTYNTPTTPTMQDFTSAGTDPSSGLPSYITNFLQQGGTGTLKAPQYTMDPGAGVTQAGTAVVPENIMPKIVPKGVPKVATKTAGGIGTAAGASAPAAGVPGLKQVGGGTGGMQQPLYVNDQWNSQGGTSMPVATPALGPQMGGQAPVWTDSKGNFFFDAQGTKPVTGPALTQFRNQFG